MRTIAATLMFLAATSSGQACSPPPVSAESWGRDENSVESRGTLPVAAVTTELRHRPSIVLPGESIGCDQFARFLIRIHFNPNSSSQPSDYGYVFRVLTKHAPLNTVPEYPIKAKIVDGFAEFEVAVMDMGVDQQSPIDVEVEIRAVDRNLRRGPRSIFRLQAKPSTAE